MTLCNRIGSLSALSLATLVFAGTAMADPAQPAKITPIPPDAEVVFASFRDGGKTAEGLAADEIYVSTLDGNVTRITHAQKANNHFGVSPDRTKIAVNRYREDTNKDGRYFPLHDYKELWILDTVNGTERKIVPHIDAVWGGLAWAPDSRHVYFSAPNGQGNMDVRRVHIDTEEVEIVTENLNALLGIEGRQKFISDIDVSGDGQWMAFLYAPKEWRTPKGSKNRIGVMRLDGSEAHFVTDGGPLPPQQRGAWSVGDFDPAIASDGHAIAFARVTDVGMTTRQLSTWDILTQNVDGSGLTRISDEGNDGSDYIPSWGENGFILYSRAHKTEGASIYIARPDGSEKRKLPIGGGDIRHAQWIPTGK